MCYWRLLHVLLPVNLQPRCRKLIWLREQYAFGIMILSKEYEPMSVIYLAQEGPEKLVKKTWKM